MQYAKKQLGKGYQFGAAGPNSFDCSGLVMKAWESADVSLPHNTVAQYNKARHIPKSNLKPGDIVFFYDTMHHNGIYIGNGKIIDAPNPSTPVRITSVDSMPYAGAARPA